MSPKPKDKELYADIKKKAKKKFKVYPSIYANSWLVSEYKKAYAKKYGEGKEAYTGKKPTDSGIPKWFDEEWVDLSRSNPDKNKWVECGRPKADQKKSDWKKDYPKCYPKSKAKKLWKDGGQKAFDDAVKRKRKAVNNPKYKGGKPTYVSTKKKAESEKVISDEDKNKILRKGVLAEAGIIGASLFAVGASMMQFELKGITDKKWWPYAGLFVAGASLHLIYEALGLNKKYCETAFGGEDDNDDDNDDDADDDDDDDDESWREDVDWDKKDKSHIGDEAEWESETLPAIRKSSRVNTAYCIDNGKGSPLCASGYGIKKFGFGSVGVWNITCNKCLRIWKNMGEEEKLALKNSWIKHGHRYNFEAETPTKKKEDLYFENYDLYSDANPKDTVRVKYSSVDEIKKTLNKKDFKEKPHARQSQIINLIHQRLRVALKYAKKSETKKRLKKALDYITQKKEESKEKTKKNQKLESDNGYYSSSGRLIRPREPIGWTNQDEITWLRKKDKYEDKGNEINWRTPKHEINKEKKNRIYRQDRYFCERYNDLPIDDRPTYSSRYRRRGNRCGNCGSKKCLEGLENYKKNNLTFTIVGEPEYIGEAEEKATEVVIKRSTNDKKKLMAVFTYPDGKTRTTHFGARGMSDYTKHGDKERMERYLDRHDNGREDWNDPTTAGALSRWVLWNKPSLEESFNDFKKRFNLKGELKVKKSAESFEAEDAEKYVAWQTPIPSTFGYRLSKHHITQDGKLTLCGREIGYDSYTSSQKPNNLCKRCERIDMRAESFEADSCIECGRKEGPYSDTKLVACKGCPELTCQHCDLGDKGCKFCFGKDKYQAECNHQFVLGAESHYTDERPMTCPICRENLRKYDLD